MTATCVGEAVPRGDYNAAVHSVFRSAVNLRLNRADRLLTLLAPSEADQPQGIRLGTCGFFSFEGIQSGEPVACRENSLRFEDTPLSIQLRGARRWKCALSKLAADTTKPSVSAAWRFAWEALNKQQKLLNAEIIAEDLSDPDKTTPAGIARKAGEAMRELQHAARQHEPPNPSALRGLIGLGCGLTPSGDDLLVGYLAGLWCTAQNRYERVQFISGLGKTVNRLSQQTNDISRTCLYHAARGRVSSRLAALAEAICRGENSNHLAAATESAMQAGHTSGIDTVTGLLLGLTAWAGPDACCLIDSP